MGLRLWRNKHYALLATCLLANTIIQNDSLYTYYRNNSHNTIQEQFKGTFRLSTLTFNNFNITSSNKIHSNNTMFYLSKLFASPITNMQVLINILIYSYKHESCAKRRSKIAFSKSVIKKT